VVVVSRITVEFCILYNCPTSETVCDRKDEFGCAGCTELREIPNFLVKERDC
jgi:hypothetical protein